MRWTGEKIGKRFAFFPVKCTKCCDLLWLEWMYFDATWPITSIQCGLCETARLLKNLGRAS